MVWCALSDVAKWPEWLPVVSKVEPLDGERLSIGSRFVVHQPELRPVTWVVTELAERSRFVWVALTRPIHARRTQRSSPIFDRLKGDLAVFFQGLLGPIMGRMFRSMTESNLAQEAASLKQRVEAAP